MESAIVVSVINIAALVAGAGAVLQWKTDVSNRLNYLEQKIDKLNSYLLNNK